LASSTIKSSFTVASTCTDIARLPNSSEPAPSLSAHQRQRQRQQCRT
jgi:hypothetical protein